MPETPQYFYEVGILAGADKPPHTQRFPARGLVIADGWIRFQNLDSETVFLAQESAVAFVRRHEKLEA